MSEQDIAYGGQAVIGGVMIQSPKGWSLGIRDKNDKLHKFASTWTAHSFSTSIFAVMI